MKEYYRILYSTIFNHFLAYRIASTAFFEGKIIEVSIFDKVVGKIALLQPVIENIPIIGSLVGTPFKILNKMRTQISNDIK